MGAQPINQARQDNIIEGVYYLFNKIDNFFLGFFQTLNPWPPPSMHSYDIFGAGMLWKPKEARILTNFNEC
jgi:hypothetical protein